MVQSLARGRKSAPETRIPHPARRAVPAGEERPVDTRLSCRHWRPIPGSLTEVVCNLIRTNARHPVPRIVLNFITPATIH